MASGGDVGLGQPLALLGEPSMQGIGDQSSALLAQQQSRFGLEIARLALDLVQPGDQRHRLAGDLAAIELVRLEQLPAGVGHAQRGRDALNAQCVVAREVIAYQRVTKALQNPARILAAMPEGTSRTAPRVLCRLSPRSSSLRLQAFITVPDSRSPDARHSICQSCKHPD